MDIEHILNDTNQLFEETKEKLKAETAKILALSRKETRNICKKKWIMGKMTVMELKKHLINELIEKTIPQIDMDREDNYL